MTDHRGRFADLLERKGSVEEGARLQELFALGWQRTIDEFPEYATFFGSEGDHTRWTDGSLAAHARRAADLETIAAAADSFDPEAHSDEERLNLDLFRRHIRDQIEEASWPGHLLTGSTGGPHVTAMNLLPITPEQHRAARMARLPGLIEDTIERLTEGLRIGITAPRVALEQMPEQIAPFTAPDGALATVVADANGNTRNDVARAFERFRRFLTEEYLPRAREEIGLSALPDGNDWYAFLARKFTTTSLTPKEIHEIGLSEVERIRRAMGSVMAEATFDGTLEEFFEFLRTDDRFFFDRAEDLLDTYRAIAKRVDPGLVKMFGALPRTPYGVEPVPDATAPRQTTAYYMPGALNAGRPGTFFANTYDLRARPKWEMEALTLHEAVPGHHLQIALAQEMGEVPRFRTAIMFTAFIEGWGLYAESLGPEMGFYADPYSRFGQLTYEMWRAIRLVVDTGMHTLGWTRDQAVALFVENAGKTVHDINVEVDRYISWPGQALAYKIGELKLKELRARATHALGEQFDVRAFHDEVLRRGALPLDLLEQFVDGWIAKRPRSS